MPARETKETAEKATTTIWLSYDLGVGGDYDGLYRWLDERGAEECGDSLAILRHRASETLADDIKAELKKAVAIDRRTKVYLIHRDTPTGAYRGIFLFGGRKRPPWTGFAATVDEMVDEAS
jgi:hypothetical protein